MSKARSSPVAGKLVTALVSLWFASTCHATGQHLIWNDATEGGTNHTYSDLARLIRWQHHMGDWFDRLDQAQGKVPYGLIKVPDKDRRQFLEADITDLARQWLSEPDSNQGILLKGTPGSPGVVDFISREGSVSLLPVLSLTTTEGKVFYAEPSADTYITSSTRKSLGTRAYIKAGGGNHALLHFPLPDIKPEHVENAILTLNTTERQFGSSELGIYRIATQPHSQVEEGIAKSYPYDLGIEKHPAVIYAEKFENAGWQKAWRNLRAPNGVPTVESDAENRFSPLSGRALKINFTPAQNTAVSAQIYLKQLLGYEPTELYFRYYLRLGDNWNSNRGGGKLPGFGGTYGRAGWGGREVDGHNGWSARGAFMDSTQLFGSLLTPIGSYLYHLDSGSAYGDQRSWGSTESALTNNRWYAIEQYLRLNTLGSADGELKAWIDGRLVADYQGLSFRSTDALKIESIWVDFYHGGTAKPATAQSIYIDNLVISSEYIGPTKKTHN
ncbi:polysaccharide lyase [Motiliproteus sediminis]|uniref:polysaccharide lyase n=1 Tax=Motiliproteus sediminis TaxID=1468178 RepID=UPI001AEFB617|nr:disaggregatase related repeat-containing protein [Motiliproteus sediminis]